MRIALDTSNNNPARNVAEIAGASLLIAKATEWSHAGLYRDPTYYGQRALARAAGIPFGAYLFLHPNVDGAAQARAFLVYANLHAGDLQPIIDVEVQDGTPWSHVALVVCDCADELERHGYQPIVYASASFWQQLRNVTPEIARWPVWEAQYPGRFTRVVPGLLRLRIRLRRGATVILWQFTDRYASRGRYFDASVILGNLDRHRIPARRAR